MKKGIHPEYKPTTIVCSCGNRIETRSTQDEIHVEICAVCHPFYTGRQKLVDTAGRVERFNRKYGDVGTGGDEAGASDEGTTEASSADAGEEEEAAASVDEEGSDAEAPQDASPSDGEPPEAEDARDPEAAPSPAGGEG